MKLRAVRPRRLLGADSESCRIESVDSIRVEWLHIVVLQKSSLARVATTSLEQLHCSTIGPIHQLPPKTSSSWVQTGAETKSILSHTNTNGGQIQDVKLTRASRVFASPPPPLFFCCCIDLVTYIWSRSVLQRRYGRVIASSASDRKSDCSSSCQSESCTCGIGSRPHGADRSHAAPPL